jgi:hypothetical protein
MKSNDVVDVAQEWMRKCKCADFWEHPDAQWYPKRLLDLKELRSACIHERTRSKILLVESAHLPQSRTIKHRSDYITTEDQNDRYVTLSYCWGEAEAGREPLKLTFETEKRFKTEGIGLHELPQTLRDAVLFAARLEKVRYIWIDSLCIRQQLRGPGFDPVEQLADWLEQGRCMDKVYRKAFLNISATAAANGNEGLYLDRRKGQPVDDQVLVHFPKDILSSSRRSNTTRPNEFVRCTILDESTWADLIDQAPVNKRAWVLQERLLAPRVLHFCYDRVAWECAEMQHAEGLTKMHLTTQSRQNSIVHEGQLKELTIDAGRKFRETRLQGIPDPDAHMQDLYIYELWKRVVETYTKTALTQPKDRLIALAGIARMFHEEMFTARTRKPYVAGLWSNNLESQLIWQVNEVYENGVYLNLAKRFPVRAPSFTWAAIDSPHGVTYGDVTDYGSTRHKDLFFSILDHDIELTDPQNPFGIVTCGQLLLKARYLEPIELRQQDTSRGALFSWRRKTHSSSRRPVEHSNTYLDAPASDTAIFAKDTELYCMPAAYGERTAHRSEQYLYCLLLEHVGLKDYQKLGSGCVRRQEQYRGFRRIGISKLGNLSQKDMDEKNLLMGKEAGEVICLC